LEEKKEKNSQTSKKNFGNQVLIKERHIGREGRSKVRKSERNCGGENDLLILRLFIAGMENLYTPARSSSLHPFALTYFCIKLRFFPLSLYALRRKLKNAENKKKTCRGSCTTGQ
jgi:hypothetical protein